MKNLLYYLSFILIFISGILFTIARYKNIDMTDLRLAITYWYYFIPCALGVTSAFIAAYLKE